MTKNK